MYIGVMLVVGARQFANFSAKRLPVKDKLALDQPGV
jgi:hypothetical protein